MKYILPFIFSFFPFIIHSQVGIGTTKAYGAFHIDAKKDNGITDPPITISDDVIVDKEGNLGIGTISPTNKLQVEGSSKLNGKTSIVDGTQGNGFVWMSDANGTGSWTRSNPSQGRFAYKIEGSYFKVITGKETFSLDENLLLYIPNSEPHRNSGGGESAPGNNMIVQKYNIGTWIVPEVDKMPIKSGTWLEYRQDMLWMIASGEYLIWPRFRFNSYEDGPYQGKIYGVFRVRIGNQIDYDKIIFEKEFLGEITWGESFYAKIDVPAPYKWMPVYMTFQRYDPSPELDLINYLPMNSANEYLLEGWINILKLEGLNNN